MSLSVSSPFIPRASRRRGSSNITRAPAKVILGWLFPPDCLSLRSKEKKAAGDVAEQLRGLSLQEGSAAQRSHHLAELERLFMFSSTGLGAGERDSFRTQLQRIPSGKG